MFCVTGIPHCDTGGGGGGGYFGSLKPVSRVCALVELLASEPCSVALFSSSFSLGGGGGGGRRVLLLLLLVGYVGSLFRN